MGYGYGFDGYGYGMMSGWGLLGTFVYLIVVIDLVLLGFWLWQQISKK